jgi:hypothetical protein
MPKSTAYFTAEGINYTYHFCGVTEIEYNFALNIDADTSQGGDIINEARRLPNQIRLSVVETDVEASPGWAASMLSALDSIRRNRVLCRLTTDMGSWDRMFIAEITATQDEMNQYGWAGDIVFMQYIPKSEQYYSGSASGTAVSSTTSTRKTQNNSSTKKNTGTKAAVTSATAGVTAVLSRAGITTGAGGGALNFIIAK